MIFQALIPITDLSSKKNIGGEIPFLCKPNVPPQKPKACGNSSDWKVEYALFWLLELEEATLIVY